jgi:Kef-type K+ transport system membrane component KefB
MKEALTFGILLTLLAIVSKVVGAGVPALFTGFNLRGASRIGIGMLPRGEVALIVAGVGLSRGVIEQDEFGVAIMMTIVTTVIAPILLVPLFTKGGSGLRRPLPGDAAAPGR